MNNAQREEEATLEILEAIEARSDVTQRHLARRTGMALGLANSYLKRCVRKGLVKIHQAPANRYLYYLTPQGFAEKSRLTAQYLSHSLGFYRRAGVACDAVLAQCEQAGFVRVALYGVSDLAEIVVLRAIEHPVTIDAVCDRDHAQSAFLNVNVLRDPRSWPAEGGAWILTDLKDPHGAFERLRARVHDAPILVPDVLSVRQTLPEQ